MKNHWFILIYTIEKGEVFWEFDLLYKNFTIFALMRKSSEHIIRPIYRDISRKVILIKNELYILITKSVIIVI
jgi:hypothetical protein